LAQRVFELVLCRVQAAAERGALRGGKLAQALLRRPQDSRPADIARLRLLELIGVVYARKCSERLLDDGVEIHSKGLETGDRGLETRDFQWDGDGTTSPSAISRAGFPVSSPWSLVSVFQAASPALAFSTNRENAGLSSTAMSASTLRSTSTAARFSPFMN